MSNLQFITVPMNHVKIGEFFKPIEKRGEPTWDKRRKRWDKKWAICSESYVCVGKCHGQTEDGRDGLFALGDWAIVRREARQDLGFKPATRAEKFGDNAVAALLRKFAR